MVRKPFIYNGKEVIEIATQPKILITRDKTVNYIELCSLFGEDPVTKRGEKGKKLKEEQLERFREFYDIDVRHKNKQTLYTIRSKYTKKELDKAIKIKELQDKGAIIEIDTKYFNMENSKDVINSYLKKYFLTIFLHPEQHFKHTANVIATCFYATEFFQQLLLSDSPQRQNYIDTYGYDFVKIFSDYVYEKLYNIIKKQIQVLSNKHNNYITTEQIFITDTHKIYSGNEIREIESHILRKLGVNDKYYLYNLQEENPQLLVLFLRLRNESFQKLYNTTDKIVKEETHIIPTNSDSVKNFIPLTHDQQIEALYIFIEYFRERLLYQSINHKGTAFKEADKKFEKEHRHTIAGRGNDKNSLLQQYTIENLNTLKDLIKLNKDKYEELEKILRLRQYTGYSIYNMRNCKRRTNE